MLVYWNMITREGVRSYLDWLFVFGDNVLRKGLGGQAKEMRGEPNAVGIITKRKPSNLYGSFFYDDDFDEWFDLAKKDFQRILSHVEAGGVVVWPADGIGTGRAKLANRAPSILRYIDNFEEKLEVT